MKVIDISAKLTNERSVIKIADGVEFTVKNDKNTVLLVQQELNKEDNKTDIERFDTILKLLIDDDAVKKLDALELPFNDYMIVIKAVLAAATSESFDAIEARFQ